MARRIQETALRATRSVGRRPLDWLHRVRFRAFATVLAVAITAFGLIAWMALPALPVIGVAVAAVAMAINTVTARLNEPSCRDCGSDLTGEALSEYGVVCPNCGLINPPLRTEPDRLA